MIKKLLSIALVSASFVANAQLVNGNFETWTATPAEPASWTDFAGTNALGTAIVKETSGLTPTQGANAVKLVNVELQPGQIFPGVISQTFNAVGTVRPTSWSFLVKEALSGTDSAFAAIQAIAFLGNKDSVVGVSAVLIAAGDVPTWASSGPLQFTYNQATASAPLTKFRIILSSGGAAFGLTGGTATLGTSISFDNVTVEGQTTGVNELFSNNLVKAFPNPATEAINFTATTEAAKVEVYNVAGQLVNSYNMENKNVSVELANYAAGMYIYNVLNNNNEVVSRGKFNVVK